MTETGRIATDLSEAGRRELVGEIAKRGAAAFETRDQTVQPAVDLSAAARAAVASDPVRLPPAAEAALGAQADAVSGDAAKFAEAQRAIFEAGRGREQAYGEAAIDMGPVVAEGINADLALYQESLAANAAARAAAARSGGRRGSRSSSTSSGDNYADQSVPTEDDISGIRFDEERLNMEINPRHAEESVDGDAYGVAADWMESWFDQGMSFGGAIGNAYTQLRQAGYDDGIIDQVIAEIRSAYRDMWDQDSRPVIGGGVLPGEIDPATGQPTPYYSSLVPPTSPDRARSSLGAGGITY